MLGVAVAAAAADGAGLVLLLSGFVVCWGAAVGIMPPDPIAAQQGTRQSAAAYGHAMHQALALVSKPLMQHDCRVTSKASKHNKYSD